MKIDSKFISILVLLAGLVGWQSVSAVGQPQAYYETNVKLKVVVQDEDNPSSLKIHNETHTQKSLINLAQDNEVKTRIEKNIVLAIRMDDCSSGTGALVVYDKNTGSPSQYVSEQFTIFDEVVVKTKNGKLSEVRYYGKGQFASTGGSEFSINSGEFTIYGTANKIGDDYCPATITGSLLGLINIGFMDDMGNSVEHKNITALIANGSTLTAKRIIPR